VLVLAVVGELPRARGGRRRCSCSRSSRSARCLCPAGPVPGPLRPAVVGELRRVRRGDGLAAARASAHGRRRAARCGRLGAAPCRLLVFVEVLLLASRRRARPAAGAGLAAGVRRGARACQVGRRAWSAGPPSSTCWCPSSRSPIPRRPAFRGRPGRWPPSARLARSLVRARPGRPARRSGQLVGASSSAAWLRGARPGRGRDRRPAGRLARARPRRSARWRRDPAGPTRGA
jgi:hypothetical protein